MRRLAHRLPRDVAFIEPDGMVIPPKLLDAIYTYIEDNVQDTTAFSKKIEELISTIHNDPEASIDYDRYALPFLYKYFAANFCKGNLAGRHSSLYLPGGDLTIADLGTGSGAGIAGFLTAIKGRTGDDGYGCRVIAIDESKEQIEIFEQLTAPYIESLFEDDIVDREQGDVRDFFSSTSEDLDIVLDSNTLTELTSTEVENLIPRIENSLAARRGLFVAIERRNAGILDSVRKAWKGQSKLVEGTKPVSIRGIEDFSKLGVKEECKTSFRPYFELFWAGR